MITPTLDKFRKIITNDNFRKVYNDDGIRLEIMDILHKCIGLASGAVINTTSTIFSVLHPMLNDFSALIGLYHNYQTIVHLIILLFVEFSKKMLCFLRMVRINIFFYWIWIIIRGVPNYLFIESNQIFYHWIQK